MRITQSSHIILIMYLFKYFSAIFFSFQESSDEDGKNFKDLPEVVGSKANVRVSVVSQESESKDDDSEEGSINCEKLVTRKKMERKTERK